MPRKNKIIIRSGSGTPSASDFVAGEPGWDSANGILYVRNAAGSMVAISGGGGGGAVSVVEYATTASFPATGVAATLYLATDSRRLFSWTGSVYAEVGAVSAYDSRWDLFIPPAPTGVAGTAGNSQVALSWTAPTVSAQTPVTSYTVQYSSNGGTSWTTFGTQPTTNSVTVNSLSNSTAYVFRVAATNAVGTGSYSSASASLTPTSGDSLTANLALLLHMEGTGASFSDSSAANRPITRVGTVTQTTAQAKYGTKSAVFAAAGDRLTVADAAPFNIGNQDFAVEAWLYVTSVNTQGGGNFISQVGNLSDNANRQFACAVNSNGIVWYWTTNGLTDQSTTFSCTIPTNQWFYVAVSRVSGTLRAYLNGTQVGSSVAHNVAYFNSTAALSVGSFGAYAGDGYSYLDFLGYIDELRLTIGSGRGFTGASVTVPSAAFPDGATSSFSPASLTPTLWLDASVSSSLYNATSGGSLAGSGAQVLRWEDQSGNGNHVTGIDGPTRSVASVNGRDSLAFSSKLLSRTSLNLSTATQASLFAVIRFATSGNQIAVAFGTDASYGGLTLEANLRTAGQHSSTFGNNALASENSATGGTVTNTARSIGGVYGSSVGTLYLDGVSAATVSRAQSLNSSSGVSLGGFFSSGYSLSGNICEVVYVPRALTAGEISSLHQYFAAKWGV